MQNHQTMLKWPLLMAATWAGGFWGTFPAQAVTQEWTRQLGIGAPPVEGYFGGLETSAPSQQAVPEPAAWVIAVMGWGVFQNRRHRYSRHASARPFGVSRRPRGFTLVELLVVIAIIGVLIALLLPAVQAAREAARRATCQNNLKQLALAVHQHHDAYGNVPSLYNGEKNAQNGRTFGLLSHSWRAVLLPFMEQQPLYDSLNFSQYATDPINQAAVTTVVSTFCCPSTPGGSGEARVARSLWIGSGKFDDNLLAATTDYNASEGVLVNGFTCVAGGWGEAIPAPVPWREPEVRVVGFKDYTDGLSNTSLVLERAGLPDRYWDNGARHEQHEPPKGTWGNVGMWAISGEALLNHIKLLPELAPVNGDNLNGMYSFHPGGALVAMADGAVRFIKETISIETVAAIISPDGTEFVSYSDL